MRIVSWNVNGLRTLKGYQPWYSHKSFAESLAHLQADIACFQECKLTRKALLADAALAQGPGSTCAVEGYQAFYNLHPDKGYSGTATWTRNEVCVPLKAEEGITGRYASEGGPSGSITAALTGSTNTPMKEADRIGCEPRDFKDETEIALYRGIDNEGRGVVIDCGMFVLFNLYCPNETGPERMPYKMAYYHCLEERVRRLREAGREVIIVGDINICRDEIDHPNPAQSIEEKALSEFKAHPARAWLDRFLAPKGALIDVGRARHPTREKMYTCWNTVIDARPVNYGARLDYTFVTPGLLPWVKDADIQPDIYGSDHCPVYLELHDERVIDGKTVHIRDLLHGAKPGTLFKAPPLACSNWPEFSSKQRKLASYFGGGGGVKRSASSASLASPAPKQPSASPSPAPPSASGKAAEPTVSLKPPPAAPAGISVGASLAEALAEMPVTEAEYVPTDLDAALISVPSTSTSTAAPPAARSPARAKAASREATKPSTDGKRIANTSKAVPAKSSSAKSASKSAATKARKVADSKASKDPKAGQMSLKGFFAKRRSSTNDKPAPSTTRELTQEAKDTEAEAGPSQPSSHEKVNDRAKTDSREKSGTAPEADIDAALLAEAEAEGNSAAAAEAAAAQQGASSSDDAVKEYKAAMAWGQIFTPPPAPLCSLHHEPAKAWTVNKAGPNHGRKFWLCNRPVGPGHEGSGVPRHRMNPELRCDYFAWDSDVRKKQSRAAKLGAGGSSAAQGAKAASASTSKLFAEVSRDRGKQEAEAARAKDGTQPHKRFKKDMT